MSDRKRIQSCIKYGEGAWMLVSIISGLVTLFVLVYLVYALFRAEDL